jgi:hypothetical protein
MVARRLLIIVAVLMGITALTAGLTAPAPRERNAPLEPDFNPVTPPAAPVTVVERTLRASAPKARTVAINEGDVLRLTVQADALGSVELVGLGQVQALAPESPAVFDVLADEAGSYPVVLAESERRLGTIRVTPDQE